MSTLIETISIRKNEEGKEATFICLKCSKCDKKSENGKLFNGKFICNGCDTDFISESYPKYCFAFTDPDFGSVIIDSREW